MAPGGSNPPGGQKNFVFVDEHNRHKRLKVMRACEGCRRRKIKCDAATTNTWPCSACTRLKLQCQPPTINQERDFAIGGQYSENEADYQGQPFSGAEQPGQGIPGRSQYGAMPPSQFSDQSSYGPSMDQFSYQQYASSSESQPQMPPQMYQQMSHPTQLPTPAYQQNQATSYYSPPRLRTENSGSPLDIEQATADELTGALGDLKIDEDGIAPYLRKVNVTSNNADTDDFEVKLPPLSTGAGSQVRIPPALMPSEEDANEYLKVFFENIHPYAPVVHRGYFMRQWQKDRKSISPLLLEAIFACAGRLSDDPAQGAQWLALAARHEDHFLDQPRLSTLQALILLLKARESAPKRGYFYKSWMTVKTAVSMARSLDLDEHLSEHENGGTCGSDPFECLTKTRIWQTLMLLEVMIGGPQGRHDYGVDPDTVDRSTNTPHSNMNAYEANLTKQFTYWVRNGLNIRLVMEAYLKHRKQKDWFLKPKFLATNEAFRSWPEELPEDLRLALPPDGSLPYLPSHFFGNMHSHYQLGIIMLQRPQLLASKTYGVDSTWRHIFATCYTSARVLCRLQEAILDRFGISGLWCMQRGINFTIYAILTCTMLHLVAITSPYPEFNTDARDYFTRHMRILEQCTSAWPMPDVQQQVDALRAAFSADINRPFELKPSFPYSSPSDSYEQSPSLQHYPAQLPNERSFDSQQHLQYQTMTPPISAGARDQSDSPHMGQPMGMMPGSHAQGSTSMSQTPIPDWDPTKLMTQWDSAFAIDPSAMAPPGSGNSPPMSGPMSLPMSSSQATHAPAQQPMYAQQQQYSRQPPAGMTPIATPQPMPNQSYVGQNPIFVSSKDWQQSVASVYDPSGLKRSWSKMEPRG